MLTTNKGKQVRQMFGSKFSDAGWKTVRSALDSWGRTLRLSVIVLTMSAPPTAALWLIAGRWL
ncbi:hypothetical protein FHX48_001450 [Microbacterium halimionae]|uniref:Uncharacterized protein n=1 Tax=Microbacterium halimionae TaxID=1526413 RepID=A0A7W3JP04_9MICO|nr:hypothetical protein [Microbacterium halimionae]NII96579.1 hypothetical protein [Microbacterium halimionae]